MDGSRGSALFADVHLGVAIDDAYVGVGFVLIDCEPADGELSVNVVCKAAFARWFSLN
jgi:hypothetical protein